MPRPRYAQISLEETPYYHVISRCVRRAFLSGVDRSSGQSYEHRRQWIEDRIRILSSLFAIDVAAYAVMSNHYHIVLKVCPEQSAQWTDQEVLQRWCSLYKGPLLVQKSLAGDQLSQAEQLQVDHFAQLFRKRLKDVSWFMKCLNEPIARQANKEDDCTGHFWESRFKCQPLLTEEALLSCMAYVDLNPVRARMADTPEESDHTSIQERIQPRLSLSEAIRGQKEQQALENFPVPLKPLLPFEGNTTRQIQHGLPFHLTEYLKLVDFTGRAILHNKRGHINHETQPILDRLGLSGEDWLTQASQFEQIYQEQFSRQALRQTLKQQTA